MPSIPLNDNFIQKYKNEAFHKIIILWNKLSDDEKKEYINKKSSPSPNKKKHKKKSSSSKKKSLSSPKKKSSSSKKKSLSSPKKKSSSSKKKSSSSPKKKSSSSKKKSSSSPKKKSSKKKKHKKKSSPEKKIRDDECPEGQERSKITGKCIDKCPDDKERAIKSDNCVKKCPSHQVRNKITGKCVNRKDLTPKKKEFVKCKPFQYRDPKTNKCVTLLNPNAHIVLADDEPIVGKCIERSKVLLRPIQQKIINYMNNNDFLLVNHGVGCGKTLTSIGVSECYLDEGDLNNEERNVVIICPAGLIINYKKEMQKYGVKKNHANKYSFYSFDKILNIYKKNDTIDCERDKTLLIIDEVHNLRNQGSKYRAVFTLGVINSKKRLLLSATPFVNKTYDFCSIINILYSKVINGVDSFKQNDYKTDGDNIEYSNMYKIISYLFQKIDIKICDSIENFPRKNISRINLIMSDKFYERYSQIMAEYIDLLKLNITDIVFNAPEKFYHGYRRAVNFLGDEYVSAKLEASLPIIKEGKKTFIFSNWLEFGTDVVSSLLEKNGIKNYLSCDDIDVPKYAFITGKVKTDERYSVIEQFNSDDPNINKNLNTLIISRAGGEGISLKKVANVIILDPAWNYASLYQIMGRAIRYNSHIELPENERVVNIYELVLECPENSTDDILSGDNVLYKILEKKKKFVMKWINYLIIINVLFQVQIKSKTIMIMLKIFLKR